MAFAIAGFAVPEQRSKRVAPTSVTLAQNEVDGSFMVDSARERLSHLCGSHGRDSPRLMDQGSRRSEYESWHMELEADFGSSILPVDLQTMGQWASYCVTQRRQGNAIGLLDGLLAATALRHELTLVTRNVSDCPDVTLINPWD